MKALLTHGAAVTLTDNVYGKVVVGSLHLPGQENIAHYHNGDITEYVAPVLHDGSYGLHTIILSNGNRYRSEGTVKSK